MSAFNTSTRREDVSLRLRAQSSFLNVRTAKEQSKKLELENRKMEERLRELKVAMSREKEEREKQGGGFWRTGQSGSLSSYATDVLEKTNKSAKDSKRKPIKVLRDEPLDIPKRSSEPGTIKYIANTSQKPGGGRDNRLRGPKCGQCEDRAACLTCVQCSEHYCSGCFAAFHLRGALKKHRSVPLQASGPRQCMSPRVSQPMSSRLPESHPSPAVGAVSSSMSYQDSARNGPEGASGSFDGTALLTGQYNEADSAASFQAALLAWRKGEEVVSPRLSPHKHISPRKTPAGVGVDTGTTMTDEGRSPEIKFTNTISYADRLMLKKHRRTDPGSLTSPRMEDSPSPRNSGVHTSQRFSTRREDTLDYAENRVSFSALYQASASNISPARSDSSRPESNLSIVELREMPSKTRLKAMDQTDKYKVQEVSSFEAWEMDSYRKPASNSRSEAYHSDTTSRSQQQNSSQGVTVENAVSETEVIDLTDTQSLTGNSSPSSRKKTVRAKKECVQLDSQEDEEKGERQQPKSRPLSRKSRPSSAARPKSGRQSRPSSRAYSRAASRLSEGFLTKTPSSALSEIASRLSQTNTHVYAPLLEDFFMAGVKPAPQERTLTPSQDKKDKGANMKVSNRLYQMAPRSWRPDSSLGEAVPLEQVAVEELETVISYTYSDHSEGKPLSITCMSSVGADSRSASRADTPVRSVSSPRLSQSRKASSQWSSRPSEARSGMRTPRPQSQQGEESGRTSRAIVMDGEDLAQYDDVDVSQRRNKDDEESLAQLEWELASESGRITADGQMSRMSVLDSVSDSGDTGSSRSSTPVIKLSMDQGFDINIKLRDDELCDETDENANQITDEQEVKDLH